ncbi:queuosine precursor transporter [Pelomonas sp. SE-A7]|uniref:queuosine precursor transporter n=1 Tax=Pelomonas sp. SE-A7 TaxID=3054953 RepID=UPI00259D0615|nr:queuosine precursor transporter [Pelomonas sp. SE-A7]MDM4768359.1 queuosine precursor transporter [Pelomonas sp. SE-A7]
MTQQPRSYKYYDLIMAAFVTVLLCSNLIGAAKAATLTLPLLGQVTFGADLMFFPLSYIFGDILTEVYGYGRDRRVVWAGFGALVFAAFMAFVVVQLPPAQNEFMAVYQTQIEGVFGNTWRIVAGSMIAFCCGSFVNSFVMAKMKIITRGKHLWARTIGSTVVGQFVDTSFFFVIAFWGIWPQEQLIAVTITQYLFKTCWEAAMTPITYKVVGFLKRVEDEDYYDRQTNFNPFSLKV